MNFANWYTYEFWRFVFVQQEVGEVRAELHRLPADAGGRLIQPGGRETADRGGNQVASRPIVGRQRRGAPLEGSSSPPYALGGFSWSQRRVVLLGLLWLLCGSVWAAPGSTADDPLPSWNDGPTKQSIIDFVTRVTKEGGPDYVAPPERVATFDNDGTLWIEQPIYNQFVFAIDEVKKQANQHPEWKDKEPFKSVLAGDMKAVAAMGEKGMLEIVAATHSGMTTVDFNKSVEAVAGDGQASALQGALHRPGLPADAGAARLFARQRLQDLHRRPAAGSSSCAILPTRLTASRPSR